MTTLNASSHYDAGTVSVVSITNVMGESTFSLVKIYSCCQILKTNAGEVMLELNFQRYSDAHDVTLVPTLYCELALTVTTCI